MNHKTQAASLLLFSSDLYPTADVTENLCVLRNGQHYNIVSTGNDNGIHMCA